MSVSAGHGKIRKATKELQVRWNDAQADWHDQNSRLFEEKYLDPLMADLRAVEGAMNHMAAVLQKVRNDCG